MIDRSVAELAKAQLRIFSGEMSPVYRESLEELNSSLMQPSNALADLRSARNQAVENERFLKAFSGLLPKANMSGMFTVNTPADIRRIQSTVVWNRSSFYHGPHYLVGSHIGKHITKWLMADANEQDGVHGRLVCGKLRTGQANKFTDRTLIGSYTEPEIERLYDAHTDTIQVGASSPQSFAMRFDKLSMGTATHEVKTPELTNMLLAEYNVFDHLARLATVFQVEARYEQLLAQ